jgi:hypothetical protein
MAYRRYAGAVKRRKRTLSEKKRQLVREKDYLNFTQSMHDEYDITFLPLEKSWFEKRSSFYYLKGKNHFGDMYALSDYPGDMVKRFHIKLRESKQAHWLFRYNSHGELVVRAGLRLPESRLGLCTFRKKDT